MVTVKDLIKKIRAAIHDTDCINYDDKNILDAINAALRFIRRTIAEIQPELLISEVTGILETGNDTIELATRPMKIIELTAGDKVISKAEGYSGKQIFSNFDKIFGNASNSYSKYELKTFAEYPLQETTLHHIGARNLTGKPQYFYRTGLTTLKIFPKPRSETAWTLRTIDDIEDLKFEDSTPVLNEFDDFIFEFCVMRLSLTEEFDMQQEAQIMANIHQQIAQVLQPPPAGVVVKGYW